jgi:cell division protein ZapA
MAQVSLTVNGRPFAVTCDDGQEARIRRLGEYVDAKVVEFVRSVGQVGEARLLLLAALVIADELAEATEALRLERSGVDDAAANAAVDAAASGIQSLTQRVEAIAARLETS